MLPIYIWIERWIGFTVLGRRRIGWWRGHTGYRTAYGIGMLPRKKKQVLSDAGLAEEKDVDRVHYRWRICGPGWEKARRETSQAEAAI